MEVATIMSTALVTASPSLPARRVVELIIDDNIGAVPVIDGDGVPVGIVTRYDIIEEDEMSFGDEVPIVELMHKKPLTVSAHMTVHDAARVMTLEHVHHLLVVDELGHLIGLVSSLDVVRWVSTHG